MPMPVASARQCLTQEAAAVLDEAVAVARRRSHAQTTSLHMVSSLLSLPNSSLRESCTRTRNNAYPTRVQFKALELSLSVALDRLPSSQAAAKAEVPPVSNSLMAAIKRSQANQRRQPESFSFYQQQLQQQQYSSAAASSVPVVKVELQTLILSILDDPLVSRVFGEAGFRSCDIKMATLRPGNSFHHAHHLFGYSSRYKRPSPPIFLCNLSSGENRDVDLGSKGYSFPFMGCLSGDENPRRIAEVMVRNKRRNPVLLGVSAGDALKAFLETLQRKPEGILPVGLSGMSVICVKDEILKFANEECDEGPLKLRFEEVERMLGRITGPGIVVNLGNLKALGGDGGDRVDGLRYLVAKLSRMLEDHGEKLWLIGEAANYEVYFQILKRFPSIEEEWDLEILPITSLRFSMGGSYPRSSLMESFVPLGGFFTMPSERKYSMAKMPQYGSRCHLCNEKCNQEVAALSNGGLSSPVPEHYSSTSPSCLQPNKDGGFRAIKAKDDSSLLNAKIAGLQKKWDEICQKYHYNQFPRLLGFQVAEKKKQNTSNDIIEQGNKNMISSMSTDLQQSSSSLNNNLSRLSKSNEVPSISDSQASSNSVTTDLGLGIIQDSIKSSISNCPSLSSSCMKDPKMLYKALLEKVGRHDEAISSVVEAITQSQTKNRINRGDVWINIQGQNRLSKRKLALALADILYGSTDSLVYVDLSFQDETTHIDMILDSQMKNRYELKMRGTVVDYLVEKLSKEPRVVFLENIDRSDHVVQNSLSLAVKTGKFKDLHGREAKVNGSIFLTTLEGGKDIYTETDNYSEEDILKAKGNSIQISIGFDLNDENPSGESVILMNKRKIMDRSRSTKRANRSLNSCLDLNRPAQESENCGSDFSTSDHSSSWLEDFNGEMDKIVNFKPLDFDTLSEKLFKEMNECLRNIVGSSSKCSLEIESSVMQQLLAAAYALDEEKVKDWINGVLRQGFMEIMGKFSLNNARSIVKLDSCERTPDAGQAEDLVLLPGKIIVNN